MDTEVIWKWNTEEEFKSNYKLYIINSKKVNTITY